MLLRIVLDPRIRRRFTLSACATSGVLLLQGCRPEPDFEALREEILSLHLASIEAHLNKDVDFFTRDVADDYVVVSNADVFHPTEEQTKAQFSNYLNRTDFTEYRDLRDPIIGFSDDGSVAWSIVQVKVAGVQTSDDGQQQFVNFKSAWINLFKRDSNRWIRITNVSNVVRE
jgi:hypothetical protein